MIETKYVFVTEDGKEFKSRSEAEAYKVNKKDKHKLAYEKYLNSYSGKRLLEHHDLSEVGVWKVSGEDPNCDFGGNHQQPHIGTVHGTLEKAILWAVEQPDWKTWGRGGSIESIKVLKL